MSEAITTTEDLDRDEQQDKLGEPQFTEDDVVVTLYPDTREGSRYDRLHGALFKVTDSSVRRKDHGSVRGERNQPLRQYKYEREYYLRALKSDDQHHATADHPELATEYDGETRFWSDGTNSSHTSTWVEDDACPVCDGDVTVTRQDPAGIVARRCQVCECYLERGDVRPPTTERERIEELKEHADGDGPLEHVGHLESAWSRYSRATDPVYTYADSGVLKWVSNGQIHSITHSELVSLVEQVAYHGQFDSDEAQTIIDGLLNSKSVDREAWSPTEQLFLMYNFKPDHFEIDEWSVEEDGE